MLTKEDLRSLYDYCEDAGDHELVSRIRQMIKDVEDGCVVAVIRYNPQENGSLDGPSEDK